MAFTVEDGTWVADANANCTVEFVDAYFTDRGNAAWTGVDAVKQQAIVRATDYIETVFGPRFRGWKSDADQSLSFPRTGLYDSIGRAIEGMPTLVQQATAEYAVRALSAALMPDPVVDATGGRVLGNRKKVGPIEVETTFSETAIITIKPYPAADRLLTSLIATGGRVVRA